MEVLSLHSRLSEILFNVAVSSDQHPFPEQWVFAMHQSPGISREFILPQLIQLFVSHLNFVCVPYCSEYRASGQNGLCPISVPDMKMLSYQYGKSHCGDKKIIRLSILNCAAKVFTWIPSGAVNHVIHVLNLTKSYNIRMAQCKIAVSPVLHTGDTAVLY